MPSLAAVPSVMSGTFLTAHALRPRRGLARGRDPLVRRAVADPRGDAAVQVQRRAVVLVAVGVGGLGGLAAHGVTDPVEHGAVVHGRGHGHWAHAGAHEGAVGRDEEVAAGARGQQVVEDDADGLVLGRGDHWAEPLRPRDPVDLHAALGDRDGGAGEHLVGQRDVLAHARMGGHPRRRLDLHVAAGERACRGQARGEVGAVLDEGDVVLVGVDAGVDLLQRDRDGDELRGGGGGAAGDAVRVAEARQVVLELLDAAAGEVAGARGGHVDRRDRAGVDGGGGRRARADAVGIGDGHRRGGRVAGADRVDADAEDVDGRRARGSGAGVVDGVGGCAVADDEARRRGVARAGGVDDDAGDYAVRARRDVAFGLRAGRVVGQVEVDGRRDVAGAGVGHGDRVDAAVGGRRSGSGRSRRR